MIPRTLEPKLRELAGYYPAVAVTGPRQSGKTTLCRIAFPEKAYVSMEALDNRDFADEDPRGFLAQYPEGAILDEIQHVPSLLSYMQGDIDERPDAGRFILTGSQHFGLSQSISQSLAGRCGILVLLPPSLTELRSFPNMADDLFTVVWQGAYPRIFDKQIPPQQWLSDYTTTYIERDVRQIANIGDLQVFARFLKLCAGRTAQEINLSALGGDVGVSHNTARAWLSVLETSYLLQRLPAWHPTIRKQVVKASKLHFFDSGLVCYLLGIRNPEQLRWHPLRGAIFESWVVSEVYKAIAHGGAQPNLFHYREARGLEIDLLMEHAGVLKAIEIKSAATIATAFFKNLNRFRKRVEDSALPFDVQGRLVFGGEDSQTRSQAQVLSWRDVANL